MKISDRNIAIRVDEELFKKIKIRILEQGVTLREYFVDLARKDIINSELDKVSKYTSEEIIGKADQVIALMKELKESQEK